MVQGGMTLIKYLLFLFNFIFWLSGIGIIVAGTVIEIRYNAYANFLGSSFLSAPILLIAVGCIISIIGFFGCCGAIRENYCMTMTFAVLLGVVFILELAAGIASYVLRNEVEAKLREHAGAGMDLYNKTGSFGVTAAWDGLQRDFKCCGLKTYGDWNVSAVFSGNDDVPDSCCIAARKTTGCGKNVRKLPASSASERIYVDGCLDKLKTWVLSNIAIVGGVGCGVAFIQVFGIICACCLAQSMRKDYESV